VIVVGPPRAVVIECNRRCGARFVREVYDGERDRDECTRAVWDANAAGWREMRGRGVRCAGCVQRYGEGERIMATTMHDALTALFECASKCAMCEDHAATRVGKRGKDGARLSCDRTDCGDVLECVSCGCLSLVQYAKGYECSEMDCNGTVARRVPWCDEWADLPHADVLRAANAAHEARR